VCPRKKPPKTRKKELSNGVGKGCFEEEIWGLKPFSDAQRPFVMLEGLLRRWEGILQVVEGGGAFLQVMEGLFRRGGRVFWVVGGRAFLPVSRAFLRCR
jgi:hypothetical protein